MIKFLTCEFSGFLKLIAFLVIVNLSINIFEEIPYRKEVFIGSVLIFGLYVILLIIKLILFLVKDRSLEYECKKSEWFTDLLQMLASFF